MTGWNASLAGDPLPWLLDESAPAVRHRALGELLDRAADDPEVAEARGAAKAVLGLARVPVGKRSPEVARALEQGVGFLLSVDPATALYPMGWGNTQPNGSWFRLGFPSGYVADVLQVMEAICEAGAGGDRRLAPAVAWLLAQRDPDGRWKNRYPYNGKMHLDIDRPGQPSRWVTLRACRVLKMVAESGAAPDMATSGRQATRT
jgi:hypothetical protein